MREITYSQGVQIQDPSLAATLAIFCGRTWLPYERTGDAMRDALKASGALPEAVAVLENDPARDAIRAWDDKYDQLYREQVFERLPGPTATDHSKHRHDFDEQSIAEITGASEIDLRKAGS